MSDQSSSPAKCPVDHNSSSATVWAGLAPSTTTDHNPGQTQASSPSAATGSHAQAAPRYAYLSTQRETSSIPRTGDEHWVYPSEAQFYAAMLRKYNANGSSAAQSDAQSHAEPSTATSGEIPMSTASEPIQECPVPHASATGARTVKKPNPFDMQVVVPIHNAVNERTWIEILKWEDFARIPRRPNGVIDATSCPGGLRLVSFKGDAGKLTPRARLKSLLGYQPPFDRHDWVIERCGQRIHYVIDYYTGRSNAMGPFSFHIDARPALDSWEGVRMRVTRFWSRLFWNSGVLGGSIGVSKPSNPDVAGAKTQS